jgi:hypothetical protein
MDLMNVLRNVNKVRKMEIEERIEDKTPVLIRGMKIKKVEEVEG